MTERLPQEELDFAARSASAETMDYYGVVSDDVYERALLNFDTLMHEIETHYPIQLDRTIDLSFIDGQNGVFL